jgi:hypothetical protein
MIVDGQRQPKPPPLKDGDIVFLLHPQPLVRILEGEAAESAWRAWQPTIADQLGVT